MNVVLQVLTFIGMISGVLFLILIIPAIVIDLVMHKFFWSKKVLILGAVTVLVIILGGVASVIVSPRG